MSAGLNFVAAGALVAAGTIVIKPRRQLGPIVAQVTIEEDHDDELRVTQHPVEQGANIADHAYKLPSKLRLILGWSDSRTPGNIVDSLAGVPGATATALQSLVTGSSVSQVKDVYAKLIELQALREPFDVYTGKRKYVNMLITRMNTKTTKETASALIVTFDLEQLIMVSTTTGVITVAPSQQVDPANTATPINSGTRAPIPTTKFDPTGGGVGFDQ